MRLVVETTIQRPPDVVFDFIARRHWQNHPRWDPNVLEMTPVAEGPIRVGSRAHVRRRRGSGHEILEVVAFEPNSRWVSRTQIGPFRLEMTALIESLDSDASRLTLIGDTRARPPIRYLLPVLAVVFRRQMRRSLQRIRHMVETETGEA